MPIIAAAVVPHPPVILPEVGHGEQMKIQKTIEAYHQAMSMLAALEPDSLLIVSPHSTMYMDWFHLSPGGHAEGDFSGFGAPDLKIQVDYDTELAQHICRMAEMNRLPAGTKGEKEPELDHGSMVPLYFWKRLCPDTKVVRMGLSGLSLETHFRLGGCIRQAVEQTDRRVVLLASGDLSHRLKRDGPYGFVAEGPELDQEIVEILQSGDLKKLLTINPVLVEQGAECGLRSFVVMAGALDKQKLQSNFLSYEGPFGVGYAVATFLPQQNNPEEQSPEALKQTAEDAYVSLARNSLKHYFSTQKKMPLPKDLASELSDRSAGVFVSLHKFGQLRGCIGTISPTTSCIGEEIIRNAVAAAVQDPRFDPVEPEELDALNIKVDVLGEAEPIQDISQLDIKRYGVIVSSGHRQGLLLPDLEGIDSAEQQVDIARQKAGIPQGADLELKRFEVIRHGEM